MKSKRRKHSLGVRMQAACLVMGAVILTGCAVGPDFQRPEPPSVAGYTATALPAQTAAAPGSLGDAQRFVAGGAIPGLAGQVAQPLFNAGLLAEARAAEAAFAASEANYRQTVLQALRNVADVLRALDHDAQTLAAQAAADQAAQESLHLTRQGYALGTVSYLQLLIAQQQAQQTATGLIAARSQRLADTVALYQSMGGGWAHDEGLLSD